MRGGQMVAVAEKIRWFGPLIAEWGDKRGSGPFMFGSGSASWSHVI